MPTENVDSASLKVIADRIRKNNDAYDAAAGRKREEALKEARRLAHAFAEAAPELRRAYLFGSLLPGREYRIDSDIDLAVEGGDMSNLMAIAESSQFDVDLVELSDLRETIADRVRAEGVVLYEKDSRGV